ncbi:MAG: winged helix-turn-helix transcriptional regulator [Promethearchaeota archaeon]
MKNKKSYYGIFLLVTFLIIFGANNFIKESSSASVISTGIFDDQRIIDPNEPTTINFIFIGSKVDILTDVQVNLNTTFYPFVFSRQISIIINDTEPITLNIECFFDLNNFVGILLDELPNEPTLEDIVLLYEYNCYFRITSNSTIDRLTIQFDKNIDYDLDPDKQYTLAAFIKGDPAWNIIPTEEKTVGSTSDRYIESTLTNVDSTDSIYFTIYEEITQVQQPPIDWTLILSIIVLTAIILTSIVIVISRQEYIKYLKTRNIQLGSNGHRLTLEEVLENENRSTILDLILSEPGIHFNELLRKTNISPGNLVWHLDVLLSYKIIGKKRFENYLVYFPYYQENPLSNIDLKLQKSELTLKLLKIIKKNPGVCNIQIAKQLNINRKTIQYHLQKLLDHNLITKEKVGRKNHLYIKPDKLII